MSRCSQDHSAQELIDYAREISELSRRSVALSRALESLTGLDPVAERERLQRGTGHAALQKVQARVEELLARAEVASIRTVGPMPGPPGPPHSPPRVRLSRSFV